MQIVGIGDSASGIEAFGLFFGAMPVDSGMGFVVVLHMSVDRKSVLPEIITRWTAMRVTEAADGHLVEPNEVYVIPPDNVGTLRDGRLRLPDVRREATPIDEFSTAWPGIWARTQSASSCPGPGTMGARAEGIPSTRRPDIGAGPGRCGAGA